MKARFSVLFCGLSSILKAQFFGPHAAFPPPFQWVYLIVQMVYNIKKKEASKREERNVMDKKKKYFDCLKEVIQVKKITSLRSSHFTTNIKICHGFKLFFR